MDLINYAKTKGGTGKPGCPVFVVVAKGADCSAETLYLIARGLKTPSPKLANRIEGATEGGVARSELRPDIFGSTVEDDPDAGRIVPVEGA